ncbi:MAG: DUF4166 domain-containing protein [Hyphomonadaceae bacterium]|jgi:hypothetical protein|nr:DUF4166 domain-containing protein [Hyphomonadaceae bacterium]
MTLPLYRRLLGERFEHLPARVRELHDIAARLSVWSGRADVERGRSWLSRMVATLFGLPPTGRDQALRVTFEPVGGKEIWSRVFGTAVFRSVQYERGGLLNERVGSSTFVFALETSADGMALKLKGVRCLGVPLPLFLAPSVFTFESERDGRYHFEVEAALPLVGRIVRYAGWLEQDTG